MSIVVRCGCGADLRAPKRMAGQTVRCADCGRAIYLESNDQKASRRLQAEQESAEGVAAVAGARGEAGVAAKGAVSRQARGGAGGGGARKQKGRGGDNRIADGQAGGGRKKAADKKKGGGRGPVGGEGGGNDVGDVDGEVGVGLARRSERLMAGGGAQSKDRARTDATGGLAAGAGERNQAQAQAQAQTPVGSPLGVAGPVTRTAEGWARFRCAVCGRKVKAPSSWAGLKGQCPDCGNEFRVPAPPVTFDEAMPQTPAQAPGSPQEDLTTKTLVAGVPMGPRARRSSGSGAAEPRRPQLSGGDSDIYPTMDEEDSDIRPVSAHSMPPSNWRDTSGSQFEMDVGETLVDERDSSAIVEVFLTAEQAYKSSLGRMGEPELALDNSVDDALDGPFAGSRSRPAGGPGSAVVVGGLKVHQPETAAERRRRAMERLARRWTVSGLRARLALWRDGGAISVVNIKAAAAAVLVVLAVIMPMWRAEAPSDLGGFVETYAAAAGVRVGELVVADIPAGAPVVVVGTPGQRAIRTGLKTSLGREVSQFVTIPNGGVLAGGLTAAELATQISGAVAKQGASAWVVFLARPGHVLAVDEGRNLLPPQMMSRLILVVDDEGVEVVKRLGLDVAGVVLVEREGAQIARWDAGVPGPPATAALAEERIRRMGLTVGP